MYGYLGYRRPTAEDLRELFGWLVERALEHDDPALLVSLAAERLGREKVVRPGVSRLERMAAAARDRSAEVIYRALSPLLDERRRAELDALLLPVRKTARTPLAWFREGATSNTPKAILAQIEKLRRLREMGVDELDLGAVNPNRRKRLANLGRRHTNQALQRQSPERRYPILLAFLAETHREITDEVIDLFESCLARADSQARCELEEFRHRAARATDEKVRMFREIGRILLDPSVDDAVRRTAYDKVGPPERLLEAVEESERLMRPADDNYFNFLAQRYHYVRQFAPAFLSAFRFRSSRRDDPLLEAISILASLNTEKKRRVPDDAPLGFVPGKWGRT